VNIIIPFNLSRVASNVNYGISGVSFSFFIVYYIYLYLNTILICTCVAHLNFNNDLWKIIFINVVIVHFVHLTSLTLIFVCPSWHGQICYCIGDQSSRFLSSSFRSSLFTEHYRGSQGTDQGNKKNACSNNNPASSSSTLQLEPCTQCKICNLQTLFLETDKGSTQ
jgi:hypothetical protein